MPRKQVTRRHVLATLGATGVTGLAGCAGNGNGNGSGSGGDGGSDGSGGSDGGSDDSGGSSGSGGSDDGGTTTSSGPSGTVRIGVLQAVSGDLQYYGQQSMWGLYSGFAYKGDGNPPTEVATGSQTITVGDVDYELLIRDSQFNPDQVQTAATNLVQNEDVDLLLGAVSSGSATRLINTVTKQAGVPTIIGPAASAEITSSSETCSEIVFRASENVAMDARSGGRYVAQETDVSKVYLFGADYSFGRSVVNNYRTVLEANGIEIVGERFVPRGYSEWEGLLDNAESAGAEGIVGGFTVVTLPNLFTTFLNGDYSYRAFGGFATRITNQVLGGVLQNTLGEGFTAEDIQNAKLGPFTSRYHWNQYDNEINSAFVDMYTDAYGVVPDLFSSGLFTSASALVQAVNESGSTNPDDIVSAMRGMSVRDTPKGEGGYQFQEYNNQARSPMTVAEMVPTTEENWDAAVQPSEPVATIPASRTTIPADSPDMSCNL